MPIFKRGDALEVQRITGYTTFGTFVKQDDEFIVVKGTVGDNSGHNVIIPKKNIDQIVVIAKMTERFMTNQEREDW